MGNGEWRMENGKWRKDNELLEDIDYGISFYNYIRRS